MAIESEVRTATVASIDELFGAVERLEHDVFAASGFTAISSSERIAEYEPWRTRSVFHVAIQDDEIIGVARSVRGEWASLPMATMQLDGDDPVGEQIEFASLAVVDVHRGVGVAAYLTRSLWRHMHDVQAGGVIAAVDAWLLDYIRSAWGFDFRSIGPEQDYMGGPVLPIHARRIIDEERVERVAPGYWSFLHEPADEFPHDRLAAIIA